MNYLYVTIYLVVCIVLFIFFFMFREAFDFLFEMVPHNVTDYNDPNYKGGIEYIFNPLRHFKL